MKELSLNVLDIAENSVKAKADTVEILINESDSVLCIEIRDNGCGMKEEFLSSVTDPFTTTRTTRKVGLGIPFFKLAAQQTGGSFSITSKHKDEFPNSHGTDISASFIKNNIDFTPLGDIISTVKVLVHGNPDIRWIFKHCYGEKEVSLDTDAIKEVVGDIPLNSNEIIQWIGESLSEEYKEIGYNF